MRSVASRPGLAPSRRLLLLAAVLAGTCLGAGLASPAQHRRFEAAIEQGRAVLGRIIADGRSPAVAVAVAAGGEVVWSEAFGLARLDPPTPASTETRFGLGSLSKTLTMAGVMALVDEERLDLDAPIERYLENFPQRGKGITLRRLAAHQSGLADDFAVAHYQTDRHFPTVESAYQEIMREPLKRAPGSAVEYATGLYTIIARAMEKAAGRPYLEIMRERVFAPARMRHVVPNDVRRNDPVRAGFYVEDGRGRFTPAPFFDPSFKLAGAGFLATAGDMARFGAALLGPSLLSDRARQEMFTAVPLADGTATEFALGLRVGVFDGRRLLHLPGGGPGISAWLFLHPDAQLAIALLSNATTGPVGGPTHEAIARAFLAALAQP